VLVVFVFLALLTNLPYARGWLYPPKGAEFLGAFYSMPDFYNYLSYVQQAEGGAFLFTNKLEVAPHAPALVNLEWWTVGRLSALIGRRPTVAYRLFGLAALLAFLLAVDRWLGLAGIPGSHRLAALLLVFLGAGFGGPLFLVFGPPAWRFLDLTTGQFPFIAALVNPHFVVGTALLLWALLAFRAPGVRGQLTGLLLGSVLGLVRPYDLVMLCLIRALAIVTLEPRERWIRRLLWLCGFAPVVAYNFWVFYRNDAFAALSGFAYSFPPLSWIALALGPAIVLAATGVRARARKGEDGFEGQAHLLAWLGAGVLFLLQPVSYSQQMLANIGTPLLAFGAVALRRFRSVATLAAAALLFGTGLVAVKLLLEDNPTWFVPAAKLQAARALREVCRPGDVALAPPDFGYLVNAYSACTAYVSHPIARGHDARESETLAFYGADPSARRAFLEARCIPHLLLPAEPGAEAWLGRSEYRLAARTSDAPQAIGVYTRDGPGGACGR
jgi:hypothetical protein